VVPSLDYKATKNAGAPGKEKERWGTRKLAKVSSSKTAGLGNENDQEKRCVSWAVSGGGGEKSVRTESLLVRKRTESPKKAKP